MAGWKPDNILQNVSAIDRSPYSHRVLLCIHLIIYLWKQFMNQTFVFHLFFFYAGYVSCSVFFMFYRYYLHIYICYSLVSGDCDNRFASLVCVFSSSTRNINVMTLYTVVDCYFREM